MEQSEVSVCLQLQQVTHLIANILNSVEVADLHSHGFLSYRCVHVDSESLRFGHFLAYKLRIMVGISAQLDLSST